MTRWPVHLYQAQIMSHLLGEGWQSLLPAPQDTHHDGEHAGAAAGGARISCPRKISEQEDGLRFEWCGASPPQHSPGKRPE